jgi:hypothetical protein
MKILLALPHMGEPCHASRVAAFHEATDGRHEVYVYPRSRSLLAYGFNEAWCEFANGVYDLFAMLHADHGPKGRDGRPWLDTLVEEMDGFGVMHAVAAIKDHRGLTSTGLSTTGMFDPVRRLSVRELFALPETFGAEHCPDFVLGQVLLPNTGVMLVRREGFPLDLFDGFAVWDKVVKVEGKWRAHVDPEDWWFGRTCARLGVRVGGTRKVITHHFGGMDYSTEQTWGQQEHDEEYLVWKYEQSTKP